jgi:hypothetical protein
VSIDQAEHNKRRTAQKIFQSLADWNTEIRRDKLTEAKELKQVSDLAVKLGGTFGFLQGLSSENDWHYAGKDVKLNTPNRPIFWFRRNKSSTTYYVLYADLSVKEVPSEQVPKMPQLEGNPRP